MDMKYDFTTIMDRSGKDALAIDNVGQHMWGNEPEAPKEGFDFIQMWVADMNFPTCPSVTEAIIERAKHPAFYQCKAGCRQCNYAGRYLYDLFGLYRVLSADG